MIDICYKIKISSVQLLPLVVCTKLVIVCKPDILRVFSNTEQKSRGGRLTVGW